MRAVIYIRKMGSLSGQQRRQLGQQWLYEAVAAWGHPEINSETCPIERTQTGKPYFAARAGIHFSISHSKDYWACALADQPVGLDLQYHKSGRLEPIARRFFHPMEAAWLEAQGLREEPETALSECHTPGQSEDPGARRAFFEVWAAKESYVKWTGQGINRHFSQFSVVDERGLAESYGTAHFWRGTVKEDYSLCLCAGESWDEVQILTVGPGVCGESCAGEVGGVGDSSLTTIEHM